MIAGPYICSLSEGNISIAEKSHIVVTNIQQLSINTEKWLDQFKDSFFDMVIVDEGHHSAAVSWKRVFSKFKNAKIVNLTATPFRSDRQDLPGELIYRYSFKSASVKGYIKKLKAIYTAPGELTTFTAKGETKTYTLKEVLKMKEEKWFSRGIALSEPCNISIVDNSLEKLDKLRLSGTKHQIIAVACSIRHAQQVKGLYEERGVSAEVIHSKMSEDQKEKVIRDLTNGTLDCIVQVQMLGEGFDHPKLSIAAIFNPFRSLAPYIQFIGRILRVIVQNDPYHPDNYGYIVTHVGLNLDEQLKRFKDFENDDKAFWEEVLGGKEPEPPRDVLEGKARLKLGEEMVVSHEIIESLFEEDFPPIEDQDIIAELESKLKNLGLDPSLAKKFYQESKKNENNISKPASSFPVSPQRKWVVAKRRLNEEAKRTASLVLNNCGLERYGMEVPYKYKIGTSAKGNYVAILELVTNRLYKFIGRKKARDKWTLEEFQKATNELPNILKALVREIKKAQSVRKDE
jgi:DNA repair protein RadD